MGHEKQPKAKIMRALSKGERAARANVMIGGTTKHKDPFDTDEKKIAELRKQCDPALGLVAINRFDFVYALFRAYDTGKAAVAQLGPACTALLKRAEEAEEKVASLAKLNGTLLAQVQAAEAKYAELVDVLNTPISSPKEKTLMTLSVASDEEKTLNADAEADRQEVSKEPSDVIISGNGGIAISD